MEVREKIIEPIKNALNALLSISSDLKEIKAMIEKYGNSIHAHTWIAKEAAIISAQDAIILTVPKYTNEKSLIKFQSQVFSQNGEDGIIAEIFRRIAMTNRLFVEIGVENGIECNTRFLLNCGWKGLWIEGSEKYASEIYSRFEEVSSLQLKVENSFVTKDNIQELLQANNIPKEFDFLSIDIDMNTHHIWSALADFKPRVVCVEYNASIPPSVDYSVPYNPDAVWDGSNYYGAGLKTLEIIGKKLGYSLVGCDYLGVNAFFVRSNLSENIQEQFLQPFTAEFHYEPPRYALLNHRGHRKHKS